MEFYLKDNKMCLEKQSSLGFELSNLNLSVPTEHRQLVTAR